tara:strand:- start:260 stop:547 length:288 start_codon:yes stop_codon:yes gene_type:complete
MRVNKLSLASGCVLLALAPGIHGLANWFRANHKADDVANIPRQYSVYAGNPVAYGGYTYPGYGPAPTVPQTSTPVSSTATSDGEATSSDPYTGKP